MRRLKLLSIISVFATIANLNTTLAYAAEENQSLLYLGAGAAKSESATVNGSTPMSIGFINQLQNSSAVWGLDISAEGTMLDSTWGQTNVPVQGMSLNLLLGRSITQNENSRFNVALLAGMREMTADCPGSNLGYQCYANTTPTASYGFNYGAVLTWSYKRLVLGVRATGVSAQALLGLNFQN